MSAQAKQSVRPVRIHVPDPMLETDVLRGVGFRATCSCGWRGRNLDRYTDARSESRAHQAQAHATPPAPAV